MNVHTDLSAAKQLNDEDQKRIDWKMSADEFIGMYQSDPLLHQSLMVYNYEFPCTKWQSHNEKEQHGGKISSPNGKDGIIFVKVHKAASTTVRNVLYQIAREKGGCYVTGEHVVVSADFYFIALSQYRLFLNLLVYLFLSTGKQSQFDEKRQNNLISPYFYT